jgi:O-antigen/teichoic acid export membrane protein
MIKNGEKPNAIVSLSAKLIAIPTIWVVQLSLFFGVYILGFLYRFDTEIDKLYSSIVLSSLMIAFVAMSLVYVYGTLLTAANKIKRLNIIAAICLGINVVLNYFLIKHFEGVNRPAEGAAIATFFTQWIFVILCIRECYSLFYLKVEWRFVGKLVAFLGILTSIYFYLRYLEYDIQSIFIRYLFCSILFLFLFRLVDFKKAIMLIFKSKKQPE